MSRRKASWHSASMSEEMENETLRFPVRDAVLGISLLVSVFAVLGGAKSGRPGAVNLGVILLYVTGRIMESYNRQERDAVI